VGTQPTDLIIEETEGCARILRLNRPEARNALSAGLITALEKGLATAERDTNMRAVVLTGNGPDFCAGADLKALQEISRRSSDDNLADSHRLAQLLRRIHTLHKPVIAAVHGHALAGGSGLACVCDYVVATHDAKFGFTEARIGFIAAIVSTFLIDRVGMGRARELLLSARVFDCEEALHIGLVNLRVEPAHLLDRALEVAHQWSRSSPSSLALTKQLLSKIRGSNLEDALDLATRMNAETRATPDCKEGIAAFLEKRQPSWVKER